MIKIPLAPAPNAGKTMPNHRHTNLWTNQTPHATTKCHLRAIPIPDASNSATHPNSAASNPKPPYGKPILR